MFRLENTNTPKIAVLRRFFLRLGDKEIDVGKDVRVIKDPQRHKVHLVNGSILVTLVKFQNGEGIVRDKVPVTPRWAYRWFLMDEGMVKSRFKPPCGKCSLLLPFRKFPRQMCKECTLLDGLHTVETKGSNGELKLKRKKRIMSEVNIWTLRQPFIVKAYSKELFLDGEPVPDLPRFIDKLLN